MKFDENFATPIVFYQPFTIVTECINLEFFCLFQAGDASGAAAKRSKSGDDVEIDMREEAQKGRVSDMNQTPSFILCLYSNKKSFKSCNTPKEEIITISLV